MHPKPPNYRMGALKIKQCAAGTQSSGGQKLRDEARLLTESGVSVLLVIKSAVSASTESQSQLSRRAIMEDDSEGLKKTRETAEGRWWWWWWMTEWGAR